MLYSINRKPTLRIAKFEGIVYISLTLATLTVQQCEEWKEGAMLPDGRKRYYITSKQIFKRVGTFLLKLFFIGSGLACKKVLNLIIFKATSHFHQNVISNFKFLWHLFLPSISPVSCVEALTILRRNYQTSNAVIVGNSEQKKNQLGLLPTIEFEKICFSKWLHFGKQSFQFT